MPVTSFHAQTSEATLAALGTTPEGLTTAEVATRLASVGPNALPHEKPPSLFVLFLKQFRGTLNAVLIAAVAVSLANKHVFDAIAIASEIVINGIVGFFQERKAERALAKLRDMVVPMVSVRRDGTQIRIKAEELVPGDIVAFAEGDRLPADMRLLDGKDVRTDESALTGESLSGEKRPESLPEATSIGDRHNMLHMGTLVTSGEGTAVVVLTGIRTAFGRIAQSLSVIKRERTPLEMRVDKLGRTLGFGALALAFVIFIGGLLRGNPLIDIFLFSVSAAVSVIPEGLPVVLAIVLAIGVQRMARRRVILRHLPAVETLGVVDVICSDKTGTLTENKMTVREIATLDRRVTVDGEGWEPKGNFLVDGRSALLAEHHVVNHLLRAVAVCNRATIELHDRRWKATGDPTEIALAVVGAKAGYTRAKLSAEGETLDEIPFSSGRKYRAVLHAYTAEDGTRRTEIVVVGALEVLMTVAAETNSGKGTSAFGATERQAYEQANATMAAQAMRVLGVAVRAVDATKAKLGEEDVRGLTMLGLVGMIDPPRAGVAEALRRAHEAGIRTVMMTGDHMATAVAIAKDVGLMPAEETDGHVWNDAQVTAMSDDALRDALKTATVFARVSPETKLRVVQNLRAMGHVVAVTGDGINDAPALKSADIGIAMGITGTDVTKEVADMVLTDDHYGSIVNAIEEGRIVFRDVKQTTSYLVMTNIGEALTILATMALGWPLPLLPAQLLWLNVVTDGFTDVSLATEPRHGTELKHPPRKKTAPILTKSLLVLTAVTATMMATGTLGVFAWADHHLGLAQARSYAFLSLSFFQLWNVFSMRSARESIFKIGWFTNRWVLAGVAGSIAMIALIMYAPFFQPVFRLVPLGWEAWAVALALSATVVPAVELYKWLIRKGIVPASWL